jgi:hypothetical protein
MRGTRWSVVRGVDCWWAHGSDDQGNGSYEGPFAYWQAALRVWWYHVTGRKA